MKGGKVATGSGNLRMKRKGRDSRPMSSSSNRGKYLNGFRQDSQPPRRAQTAVTGAPPIIATAESGGGTGGGTKAGSM
jgi:hypothetical protein